MKHIKKLADNSAYNSFIKSPEYIWPNVSKTDSNLYYKKEENNIIRYWAPTKLAETTSEKSQGLHTNLFNATITSHTFENGIGTIVFDDDLTIIKNISATASPAYGAFGGTNITNIILPKTITSIGSFAFCNCIYLNKIELTDIITYIGMTAFRGCTNLKQKLKLPRLLSSINAYTFGECNFGGTLKISKKINSISTEGFYRTCFDNIIVDNENQYYDSRNNCNALINSSNVLIRASNNTIIPNNISEIKSQAFSDLTLNKITSIKVPEGQTYIPFIINCINLETVELPSTITNNVNFCTISNCPNLKTIIMHATTPPTMSRPTDPVYVNSHINNGTKNSNGYFDCSSITIYVPDESVEAYKDTTVSDNFWRNYNIQPISSLNS